jgi:hypothetical protein
VVATAAVIFYTERRQTKREGREVAIAAVFATQRERQTNREGREEGSHCRCVCYTEGRQTKREGREVAIADVFFFLSRRGRVELILKTTQNVCHST